MKSASSVLEWQCVWCGVCCPLPVGLWKTFFSSAAEYLALSIIYTPSIEVICSPAEYPNLA